jgi:hypothetical protein
MLKKLTIKKSIEPIWNLFYLVASLLSINRMKQRLSFALALSRFHSKFFTGFLHRSTRAFERSITYLTATGTNPDLP